MNIFTTDAYLQTAGDLFFPQRSRTIEVGRLEGRRLRVLVLDGTEVVGRMPFYDFTQPLDDAKGPVDRDLSYHPLTVLETQPIAERTEEPPGQQPSPYIDWTRFSSWADYEAHVKASPQPRTGDSARQRRRLEKDLGPLRFELDDTRPATFDTCIRWKSSQYRATGLTDMFADPRNVALFRRLRERGVLQVNSLSAGDTLLAVHFSSWHDRRTSWWVPAYDPERSKFSPGRLLLEDLMKASFEREDVEFDFLIGAEGYKFMYATHNRVIGELGLPPLKDLFVKKARREMKAVLEKYPKALELARSMEKRFREFTS
jgi:hypothetical protein